MNNLPLPVVGQAGSLGHRPALMLVGAYINFPIRSTIRKGN